MNVTVLNYINVTPPMDKIFSRLGYSKGKTQLSDNDKKITKRYVDEALALISLKAVMSRLPIINIEDKIINLASGISFISESLAKLFSGCQEVLFMGATSGDEIITAIENFSKGVDVTAALIYDAVASEMADEAIDWIYKFLNNNLRRENKSLTSRRFSAGYGDFYLEYQKLIHEILEMEKIGVSITENFILVPEKSVTALAGIKQLNNQ